MTEDKVRVLIGDDDLFYIVDKATFDRLAVPLGGEPEPSAPPNLRLCARILENAGYTVMKKETAKQLLLAYQAFAELNQAKTSK
jgi:hypothetical protein